MVSREEILLAARNRMMQYGIQKTTMSEVAQDANIAVGTLYLYFKNKEEIVLAIAEECRRQQAELAEGILGSALSPDEKLKTFLLARFRHVKEVRETHPHQKEFFRLLIQLTPTCLDEWRARFEAALARILQEGQEQGIFHLADPAQEASVLFLSVRSFYPLPLLDLPQWPREEELSQVVDWFIGQWKASRHAAHVG